VQKNRLASLKMIDASGILFNIDQMADSLVINQLQHLSPISALVLYGAGIATSLSPCALSVLPLTIGYLGGSQKEGNSALLPAIAFTLGLASVLSVLGLLASSFGNIYGTLVTVSTSSTAINPFYRY
jgi:cytochrome c-type biogenesis protein